MMNDLAPEVGRRKRAAWGAYKSIEDVVKKTKNTRLRAHLFNTTISTYCSPGVSAGIAVLYVVSNVIAYACFAVGFAETLVNFLRNAGFHMIDASANDMRIVSPLFCINVMVAGMLRSRENFRCRLGVLVLVALAATVQLLGLMMPSLIMQKRIDSTEFKASDYNPYGAKAMGFIVYFPAVTCIFAGLNMGGNFRNKKEDIFRGTSLALGVSSLAYLLMASLEAHFISTSSLVLETVTGSEKSLKATQEILYFWVVTRIFSADFNRVASILTIYYLSTYCLLNYIAFMASLQTDKPMFRFFKRWVALFTSFLCVHLILAVSWELTNAAILTFFKFYIFIKWKQSQTKGDQKIVGSSYTTTLGGLKNMGRETAFGYKPQILVLTGNPATRPALVDFADNIVKGRSLLTCGYVIPFKPSGRIYMMTDKVDRQMSEWLTNRNILAYPAIIASEDQAEGAATLLQTTGIGKLRPNILMVGFKTKWEQGGVNNMDNINTFYEIVMNAFEKNVGVAIFRNSDIGFDLTERLKGKNSNAGPAADENGIDLDPYLQCNNSQTSQEASRKTSRVGGLIRNVTSFVRRAHPPAVSEANGDESKTKNRFQLVSKHSVIDPHDNELVVQLERFRTKVHKGTIDVWWLREDGGLTLLLPYLLTLPGTYLEGARIRVFVPGGIGDSVANDQKHMAALLKKFRIEATDLHVINTMTAFDQYVSRFKEDGSAQRGLISQEELQMFRGKTNRYLRTGELLQEHSREADLVVV
ncbi:hypothetical protein ANCCEY_03708 [Ancylostoma ceylanicum]|uniref:SLC12A transporter C-terminal domain-containing protein n=1 Tax=Ancylostoma ceylanicum TaxID=53326 RepID=A0A0D6MAT1_9BILA|nr:hypothetical protein ANCCEY_03708 [Ancylostoma ceylanicum]